MGQVIILPETTKNPLSLIGERAGICWNADVSDDEKNIKRGIDCIEAGHGRTMEFVDVHMIIDGYSAKVLREYYTHIGGSPTRLQASTRYIDYSKGNGFKYTTPNSIDQNGYYLVWKELMDTINDTIKMMIKDGVPVEDATMALPLAYSSKMVDKRNLRNLVDMSRQRMCSRAYWEYRELFRDICNALRDYSDQWAWIVDNLFKPKCEVYGYCDEKNSCGRMPRKEDK